jgi:GNAT superfamily N-acetyltransferase
MALELIPFADEHLDDAAGLLAGAHRRHRDAEPLLGEVTDYRAQVEEEWRRDGASGALARHDGAAAGYLIGAPATNDNRGGTRILSGFAGQATDEPELARDLFAAAAERWSDEGHTRFAAVAPSHDAALVDAWFRVGFGLQFAYAVRETEALPAVDAGVTIRSGTPDDLVHLVRFDRVLWELQARSPSFSNLELPDDDAFREDWADTWDEPDTFWSFMAERDGEVIGEALLYRRPTGDLRVPERNVDLAHAATDPAVRGSGAGLALAAHVLRWAHEHGFRSMTTDFRSVNLLASRFWTRRGFRPTHLRLYRAIP